MKRKQLAFSSFGWFKMFISGLTCYIRSARSSVNQQRLHLMPFAGWWRRSRTRERWSSWRRTGGPARPQRRSLPCASATASVCRDATSSPCWAASASASPSASAATWAWPSWAWSTTAPSTRTARSSSRRSAPTPPHKKNTNDAHGDVNGRMLLCTWLLF